MLHLFYSNTIHNIENIPEKDIVCLIYGKEAIINQSKETIIQIFKKENVDIIISSGFVQQSINLHSIIGYKWAVNSYINDAVNVNMVKKIDKQGSMFLNMYLVDWKDIWFQNGQIYNRIMEETPCFVIFNFNSWQTQEQENIVPVFMEKIEKSLKIHLPVAIPDNYAPCYKPRKQQNIFQHTIETRRILSNLGGVFYINLERRTDRREKIEGELTRYGIYTGYTTVERFPAIDTPGRGIVGCTYSHLAVYKLAKERGYKNVLILEDDFVFTAKKKEVYENLRKLFDSESQIEYDVCMLAYNNIQSALPTEYDFLLKTVEAWTASGYIVNSSMYDRLIELYERAAPLLEKTGEHWNYANDQVWKRLQQHPEVKWYCFKERLGKQSDGYSDNSEKFMELMEH